MKQYSDKVSIEMTYTDLSDIVQSLLFKAEKILEIKGPAIIIRNTIDKARKLNNILKAEQFNYWEESKFQQLEELCDKMEEDKNHILKS